MSTSKNSTSTSNPAGQFTTVKEVNAYRRNDFMRDLKKVAKKPPRK
jgi:hypothetical protein